MSQAIARIDSDLRHGRASLSQSWATLCESWDDSVRRRFERECWEDLEGSSTRFLAALEELDRALAQAERELK